MALVALIAILAATGDDDTAPRPDAGPFARDATATAPRTANQAGVAATLDRLPTLTPTPPERVTRGEAPAGAMEATLGRVTDGDTIRVRLPDGRDEAVRLILIDSPEIASGQECYGAEAADYLARLLPQGAPVWLERDVSERDRFGRLLRYVWAEHDGAIVLINEQIVRDGYAVLSTYPPDVRYEDRIAAAQRAARSRGAGLWDACGGPDAPAALPTPSPTGISGGPPASLCDPAYPGICIPPSPPDLDCGDIPNRRFTVRPPDPHRFDGDHDGIGCEGP